MKIEDYLITIGQEGLLESVKGQKLNSLVDDAFEKAKNSFDEKEIKKLFEFKVAPLAPDGSCAIDGEPLDYSLYEILGLQRDLLTLANHTETIRLWRLNEIVEKLFKLTGADWLGIYRKIKKDGQDILLKEAYRGEMSRPEFPLTKEFAEHSNNSTVGMTGKAIIVKSVSDYEGPYYECDVRVESEFCCPILTPDGEVVGIIDAESFKKNFFTHEKLLQIVKVCMDLG